MPPEPEGESAYDTGWLGFDPMLGSLSEELELLADLRAEGLAALLSRADLTEQQVAALDMGPTEGLAGAPDLLDALRTQGEIMEELEGVASGELEGDYHAVEAALADLRAATSATVAQLTATQTQALQAVQATAAALTRRRDSLAEHHRKVMARVLEREPEEQLLYLLALAGDTHARDYLLGVAELRSLNRGATPDVLALEIILLALDLEDLSADTSRLLRRIAVLLVAVVLAPVLYGRRHSPPRDLLRGSQESHAPPANRAALTLRALASVVGDPSRTSPP